MKLILYSWQANNEQILSDNLTKMGFEIVWFQKECKHYTRDMELAMEMIPFIHEQGAEAVVSFNYFPIISMICNTCQIPYYAWVYDCPHFTLYAKQISMPCNHIGIFDREMVRQLEEEYGITTVFHAPLSADADYFENIITHVSRKKREKYQCDVSFVGSLYTDEHNYYDMLLTEATERGTIDMLIRQQYFCYEVDYLRQAVEAERINFAVLQKSMEEQGLMLGDDYFARPEDILMAAVLEKKVTVEERKRLLTAIAVSAGEAKRNVSAGRTTNLDFRLYTGSDTKALSDLDAYNYGTVDYHTQMPLVFAGSKINLNISLRSIHSGVPLRVFDIMACGGFVLTNRQPEIEEYFKDGVEMANFGSMEECLDKVRYYLSHEEERQRIAKAGQRKVKEQFSYEAGAARLFGV
ncbi:MAG: glycosyltransferase [Lachnospiraceae bacterium]|nr:glycosyltransferase [Lachnospiraceae bacterium]